MQRRKRAAKPGKIGRLRASADEKLEIEYWDRLHWLYRPIKRPVTLRLDADVIDWFKKPGRGYQTRINRTLRKLMLEELKRK